MLVLLYKVVKGIFIVLDGVADQPCHALGQKTPLEVAKTPYLDRLAKKSRIDYCYTVKEGLAPESSNAVISLLGYDPNEVTRGRLQATGAGIKLNNGDLALRCNFASIDGLGKGEWEVFDRRAGRTLSTKEAKILAKAINDKVKLPFKFEFYPTIQHRGVLVIRGGFSDNITNVDQAYGQGIARSGANRMVEAEPLDDEEDSKLSADLVNMFVRHSHEILDKHDINLQRARKGLYAANAILCRDAGSASIRLKKLKGRWMALGYMGLEIGIAEALKMDIYKFRYPKMRGIDVYGNLYKGLNMAIKKSVRMILRNRKEYDYFYIHIKETDIPGHDNKPLEKVKMIEMLDKGLFRFLGKFVEKKGVKLVVTADHTTSCRLKAHSADPVPVLFYNPLEVQSKDRRFMESDALEGKKIPGRKLLEKTLFEK